MTITITTTILIVLGSNGHGSVAMKEFKTMESCLYAKQQVEAYRGAGNLQYGAMCVPKFKE